MSFLVVFGLAAAVFFGALFADQGLVDQARAAAAGEALDQTIFLRQVDAESAWNPRAVSRAGAIGLCQIVPRYHPGVDPWSPSSCLPYMARLDREYLDRFGSWALALAAYNAGENTVLRAGGVPWNKETRGYIAKILGADWTDHYPSVIERRPALSARGGVRPAAITPTLSPNQRWSDWIIGTSRRDRCLTYLE